MKRLISTKGLPKAEWLAYRKQGITGTDAGAITGMNPFASAFSVYQDKLSEAIEEYDNEAMRLGRDMEEYVAKRFEEETGLKVRRANAIYQNEEHPIMLADFDRIIVGEKVLYILKQYLLCRGLRSIINYTKCRPFGEQAITHSICMLW